jgi:hypothetical protein
LNIKYLPALIHYNTLILSGTMRRLWHVDQIGIGAYEYEWHLEGMFLIKLDEAMPSCLSLSIV